MKKFKSWFNENKVLLIGLLAAIAMPLYDLSNTGETSVKVIVMSAAIAATSFLARNLRGQWATIIGIVGMVIATYVTQEQLGRPPTWFQMIMQFAVLFLAALVPPPKSRGYEKTEVIEDAKKEGEQIVKDHKT